MTVETEGHNVVELVICFFTVFGGYSEIIVMVRIVASRAVLDLEGVAFTIDCSVSH